MLFERRLIYMGNNYVEHSVRVCDYLKHNLGLAAELVSVVMSVDC